MITPDVLIDRIAQRLRSLPERRHRLALFWIRVGLALLAGAGAALAHPPFGVVIGLLGYPLLMILSERSDRVRGAFWMGWLAGFAYFFVSCWWVAEAFLVNPEQVWMAPFAASLLPAGLGLFWGSVCALYRRLAPIGVVRVLLFTALFCTFEWLRGHVLTGFPWNPAGASWSAGGAMSQSAALVGVYGLSLLTVAGVTALGPLIGPGAWRDRWISAGLGVALLAGMMTFGLVRLGNAEVRSTGTVVRLVQANVEQESKWTPEAYRSIVERYLQLTREVGPVLPDIIVWPEGALPAADYQVFAAGAWEAEGIAASLQPGQTLVMGLPRGVADPTVEDGARFYNSVFALQNLDGVVRTTAIYDKHRLVPFGEYLPLGSLMTKVGLRSLVHMPADFSAGPRPAPLSLHGLPSFQPLICYESLYPGFTPGAKGRPEWIVNASNDAWFGKSSGPLQHLNLASYRAIETGLPIARSTPTGVSAMIDPWGRIVGDRMLPSGGMGVVDVALPARIQVTVFGRTGDAPFFIGILLSFILSLWPVIVRSGVRSSFSTL